MLRLLGTAIAFGVVAVLVWLNWIDFLEALQNLPLNLLLIVLLLAFASRIMVTLRWFILLRVVEPEVPFWKICQLSFVGLFTTNVLPSTIGGDVVKLGGAVHVGLESAGVTASLVIDRLVGMATMSTFLPFGISRVIMVPAAEVALTSSGLGISLSDLWMRLITFFSRTGRLLTLWFQKPFQLGLAAGCSFIHMACTFSMVMIILQGLDDPISWWTAGGLWVLVYFITLIPISLNGLGLQEASLSLIFATFGGVAGSNSLVLALLMRVMFMIASLPGAFFLPGILSGDSNPVGKVEETRQSPDNNRTITEQ